MGNKKERLEGNLNTIIGKGSTVNGTIEVEGGIRIDGVVKGKIISNDNITIGGDGAVEADLNAKTTVIGGSVVGTVTTDEKIELQSKAKVTGEITTKILVVEQGAIFHGKCNMTNEEPREPVVEE